MDERRTVFIFAVALTLAGAWNAWRAIAHGAHDETRAVAFLIAGGGLAVAAIASPRFARAFHRTWMRGVRALATLNTYVLLGLIYGAIFVPYRWIGRMRGRDPLHRRMPPRESYWEPPQTARQEHGQFEQMY